MSDTPQGEAWWLATDGKWYPPGFSDRLGRRFYQDPTGRHGFRAVVEGQWSERVRKDVMSIRDKRDPDGLALLVGVPVPVRAEQQPAQAYTATAAAGLSPKNEDGVGASLEIIGWIALGLSVLGGLGFAGDGEVALGLMVGLIGAVQSLLLVGFARVIRYTHETAVLMRLAVEER